MQRKIRAMFLEIVISSVILAALDAALSAILVFALSFFVLIFFRVTPFFGIIPASVIMIIVFAKNLSKSKVAEIEQRYPALNERLRTSRDYMYVDNPIVDELNKEVLHYIKNVDVHSFLNPKSMFFRTVGLSIVLFLITAISATGFSLFDVSAYVRDSGLLDRFNDIVYFFGEDNVTIINDASIYDDDGSFAKLGDKEMRITVGQSYTDIDITKVGDPEKNDFGGGYPGAIDIGADAQSGYSENIPKEHKDIIKKYFETIHDKE